MAALVSEDMPEGVGPNASMQFGDATRVAQLGSQLGAPPPQGTPPSFPGGAAARGPASASPAGPGAAPTAGGQPPQPQGVQPMTPERVDREVFSAPPNPGQHVGYVAGLRALAASGHYPMLHALAERAAKRPAR